MARTNVKVIVKRPGFDFVNKIPFTTLEAGDEVRIPRRTPFKDVANLQYLVDTGFLRSEVLEVTDKYGGKNDAGSLTNLGLTLPRTEKLILLVKNPVATKVDLTISGNKRAGTTTRVVEIPAGAIGDIYELDLFDLGLMIEDNVEGSAIIKTSADIGIVLVARF